MEWFLAETCPYVQRETMLRILQLSATLHASPAKSCRSLLTPVGQHPGIATDHSWRAGAVPPESSAHAGCYPSSYTPSRVWHNPSNNTQVPSVAGSVRRLCVDNWYIAKIAYNSSEVQATYEDWDGTDCTVFTALVPSPGPVFIITK